MLKMLGSLLLPLLILPTVVITRRPTTQLANGSTSCVHDALCEMAPNHADGFTCPGAGSSQNTQPSVCDALNVHYDRWEAETVVLFGLLKQVGKILKAVQAGQEAFEGVWGAIRQINLRLQVGKNATSQLLAELDTLRGRQAVSAALQVAQFLMFIGYLVTLSVIYMVKQC